MLPAATLEAWRSAELRLIEARDPLERWTRWIECLAARAHCTGARLGRWLIDLELCTLEDLEACVLAQLDAGLSDDPTLRFDLGADLWVLQERGSIEQLERLAVKLDQSPWLGELSLVDHLHVELATRRLDLGRIEEVFAALERVRWPLPLIGWLEQQHERLEPGLRERVAAHAWAMVERWPLAPEFHVGLLAQIAVITRDAERLARVEALVDSLPPERLAVTPDYPDLREDVAWALARFGRYAEAERRIAGFAPEDRWPALLRLLPIAPDPDARTRLIDALLELVEPLELRWAWLVEPVPETGPAALAAIREIVDPDRRLDELCGVAPWLEPELARSACAEAIELREPPVHERGSKAWVSGWERVLAALTGSGCELLLELPARRELISTLLADPEIDLWGDAGPVIPDELALAVLERSSAGLAVADHYVERELWIELGGRVLDRVPPDAAAAWRTVAAVACVGTPFDRGAADKLSLFSPAQQREIVLARLEQHRREFVPAQVFGRWLATLAWTVPVSLWRRAGPRVAAVIDADVLARQLARADVITPTPSADPDERARDLAAFEQLTCAGWPTTERRDWALALLYRGAGEAVWLEAIAMIAAIAQPRPRREEFRRVPP